MFISNVGEQSIGLANNEWNIVYINKFSTLNLDLFNGRLTASNMCDRKSFNILKKKLCKENAENLP